MAEGFLDSRFRGNDIELRERHEQHGMTWGHGTATFKENMLFYSYYKSPAIKITAENARNLPSEIWYFDIKSGSKLHILHNNHLLNS